MKSAEALNILAMTADAEARSTAALIEMIAAVVLLKLNPPANHLDTVEIEIKQSDLDSVVRTHSYNATYDSDGTMTLRLTPIS